MTVLMFFESCCFCSGQEVTRIEIPMEGTPDLPEIMAEGYKRHIATLNNPKRLWHKRKHQATGKIVGVCPTCWKRENKKF